MITRDEVLARRKLMDAAAAMRAEWDARKTKLWAMQRNALYHYAKEIGLPTDLHRPLLIQHILKKEFATR